MDQNNAEGGGPNTDLISHDVAEKSDEAIEALLRAVDDEVVLSEICQGFALKYGFDFFSGVFQNPHAPFVLSQYPREWYDLYKAQSLWTRDPVVKVAFASHGGFFWDEISLDDQGKAFFAEAAAYGVVDGLCIPARGPLNSQFLFSLASNKPIVIRGVSRRVLLMRAHWFALQVLEAGTRLAKTGMKFKEAGALLTDREKLVLDMLGRGLGVKEISRVMSVSVTRVNQYLDNLKGKYRVGSREEVLVKAAIKGELGRGLFPAVLGYIDEDDIRDGHDRNDSR